MATSIRTAVREHEAWMKSVLGDMLVVADLREKHRKMRRGPFPFLRATFWRWAQTAPAACPDIAATRPVLAVGDLHLENFGTWRDAEGRLVFGVNDFDEAAVMPWALDPLRLVTSALLARGAVPRTADALTVATALLAGYRQGLGAPGPILLDHGDRDWMRAKLAVAPDARHDFWQNMLAPDGIARRPAPLVQALRHAMPAGGVVRAIWPRSAGAGSLGRPRLTLVAEWRGGPVLREAKALLPSAWTLTDYGAADGPGTAEIAAGPYRSPDPWFAVRGGVVLRRLSPNNRKLDAKTEGALLLASDTLRVMGQEIAAIHAGSRGAAAAIGRALDRGDVTAKSLAQAALVMAALTTEDQERYARG